MGRDKAQLEVAGISLFERVLQAFTPFFEHILIAGDRPDLARPGIPSLPDRYPGSALGGLFTGLAAATTPWVFVAACDMPWPAPGLIRALLERRSGYQAVVPRTASGLEPLFALYHKACLEPMEDLLKKGDYRIYDFYPRIRVRYLAEAELPPGWQRALVNVNTPEDLRRLKESP